jgi:hypothetical protein
VVIAAAGGWDSVEINDNTFVSESTDDCLINHEGGFATVSYSDNEYRSAAAEDSWFCVDGDRYSLTGWATPSGESDATESELDPAEPTRNLDSYAAHLSIGSTLAEFAASARNQSRHRYRPELNTRNASNYIREGFGQDPR